jgi:hypothetical protein
VGGLNGSKRKIQEHIYYIHVGMVMLSDLLHHIMKYRNRPACEGGGGDLKKNECNLINIVKCVTLVYRNDA